jgi:hypothetical protein
MASRKDDVLILKNGDRMTGEIKGLQRGELNFKADYMAESVRIDWNRVDRIETKSTFLIQLVDGHLFTAGIKLLPSTSADAQNVIIDVANSPTIVRQLDVLRISPVETGFWKQLEGSVDFGLSYTSGNKQYSTELTAAATYRKGDHTFTSSIDSAFSGQPKAESTKRNQFTFDYRKQVNERWYVGAFLDLLRSDQQSLALRTTVGGLIGRNLRQTENTRYSVFAGAAFAREKYSSGLEKPRANNVDSLVGFDYTTFRFSRTDIRSRFMLFPSLTTPGRVRMQATSDLRIKVVTDLWWGFHLYENFDSKPPVRADKNELGVSTSIGWKF